jgi:hypothetical protein
MSSSKSAVDTRRLNAMLRELAQATGRTMPEIVDQEVARVLETTLARTRVGKSAAQVKEEIANDPRAWRTYDGIRYNVKPFALATRSGKARSRPGTGIRYPAAIWSRIKANIDRSNAVRLAYAKGARGLGKRQWLELARMLGLQVKAPAYVASAKPDRAPKSAMRIGGGGRLGRYAVQLSAGYRNNPYVGARGALESAMRGRVAFFRRNLREGVFRTAKRTAEKYGGTAA